MYQQENLIKNSIHKYSLTTFPNKSHRLKSIHGFIQNIIIHSKSKHTNPILISLKINNQNFDLTLLHNKPYILFFKSNSGTISKQNIYITTNLKTQTTLTLSLIK